MKKIITLITLVALVCFSTFAQVPKGATTGLHSKAHKVFSLGMINDAGTIAKINPLKVDTLYSQDTLFFIVQINHSAVGYPYITVNTAVGTTSDTTLNTTSTATFWQSADNSNWTQVKYVSSTATLLYDTTLIYGRGANNISAFDTTLVFGRGANNKMGIADTATYSKGRIGTGVALYPVYRNRALYNQTTKNRALYSALETISKAEAVYSVSIPRSYNGGVATPTNEVSFWRNNIKFESQYLGIRFISGTKTGSKMIYTGTVRFNKSN
jgi:hypothetical protein